MSDCWYEIDCDHQDDGECDECQEKRAEALVEETHRIENDQRDWHEMNLLAYRMRYNRDTSAFDWGRGTPSSTLKPREFETENVIMSIAETLTNVIGKNRPRPTPQTHGASWAMRREARKLDKAIYAEFMRNDVYEKGKWCFEDAFTCGLGAMRVDWVNGNLEYRRVFPDSIIVDHYDTANEDRPRCVRIREMLSEDSIEERFGEFPEDLKSDVYDKGYRTRGPKSFVCIEAWRLPYGDDKGRHTVVVEKKIVLDEEWDEEFIPISFLKWSRPAAGFYPAPGLERAIPFQIDLSRYNKVARIGIDLVCRPRFAVHEGSNFSMSQVNNDMAAFYTFRGQPPVQLNWGAFPPEFYNERSSIKPRAFAEYRITPMAASAMLPPGTRLDSSEAIQEYTTVQEAAYTDVIQGQERFYMQIAENSLRLMKRVDPDDRTATYLSAGRTAEVIDWKSIDIDEHRYVFSLQPTSLYSMSPASRAETLKQMLDLGAISPVQYLRHLGNVDVPGISSLQLKAEVDIEKTIEMLEDYESEFRGPEGYQDLVLGLTAVTTNLLEIRHLDDVPDDIIARHERWLGLAQALADQAANPTPEQELAPPEQMMPAGMNPGMPPGAPMMPPGMPPQGEMV